MSLDVNTNGMDDMGSPETDQNVLFQREEDAKPSDSDIRHGVEQATANIAQMGPETIASIDRINEISARTGANAAITIAANRPVEYQRSLATELAAAIKDVLMRKRSQGPALG